MSNLTPDAATEQEVQQLLKRLADLGNAWVSEPALRALSPPVVEALATRASVSYQSQEPYVTAIICSYMSLIVCMGLAAFLSGALCLVSLGVAAGCLMFASIQNIRLYRLRTLAEPKYALFALTRTEDIRVLPILIQATEYEYGKHPETMRAIWRLLPNVTEEHVGLLNAAQRTRCWSLVMGKWTASNRVDVRAIRVGMQALCIIGDQSTLTHMKYLGRDSMFNDAPQNVIAIAQALIPVMEARLRRQEVPATLLRPSDMPTASPDILLRPATPVIAEPVEQLLRAATSETNGNEL